MLIYKSNNKVLFNGRVYYANKVADKVKKINSWKRTISMINSQENKISNSPKTSTREKSERGGLYLLYVSKHKSPSN